MGGWMSEWLSGWTDGRTIICRYLTTPICGASQPAATKFEAHKCLKYLGFHLRTVAETFSNMTMPRVQSKLQ